MTDEDGTHQLGNGYYPSLELSTLNIESPELHLQVKLYPNPVSEALFITHPTEQYFEIILLDLIGKEILKTEIQKDTAISLHNLISGIYIVTVTGKDTKLKNTYKIIKK